MPATTLDCKISSTSHASLVSVAASSCPSIVWACREATGATRAGSGAANVALAAPVSVAGTLQKRQVCAHLAMDLSQFKHCLVSKAAVSLASTLSRAEVYPCNNSSFSTDLPGFTVCDGCLPLRSLSSLHVAQSAVLAPDVGYNTPHE